MSYNWNKFVENDTRTVTVAPIKLHKSAIQYQDARSATFFAMGMAIKDKEPVTLLLPGEYLANAYTAITEAWFQKAELIIYAFYKNISDVNTSWADRCAKTITLHIDEYNEKVNEIFAYCPTNGPLLINVVGIDLEEPSVDYSSVVMAISEIDKSVDILCYNSNNQTGLKNIDIKYKYGVLSKYIGMSVIERVGYLLCNADCVLVDVNIFRTRYANGNMKIVILDDGQLKENQIDEWITSNGWRCKRVEQMSSEAAKWIKEQTEQTVLIVG